MCKEWCLSERLLIKKGYLKQQRLLNKLHLELDKLLEDLIAHYINFGSISITDLSHIKLLEKNYFIPEKSVGIPTFVIF